MILNFSEFILQESNLNVDNFYQKTLKDDYWKNMSELYPNYNSVDSTDNQNAVDYIFKCMKNKYKNINLDSIEDELKTKIKDGMV